MLLPKLAFTLALKVFALQWPPSMWMVYRSSKTRPACETRTAWSRAFGASAARAG